ncbi:hypothetical protein CBA19C8_35305 [Paraburkholderia terrae]|nr:hypothetical protein CBA19C8_35305 [Paraburkholderia terrae]
MSVKIGISGWRYGAWRGVFYPENLPQTRELEFASRAVDTIEINGSHYSLQSPTSYRKWYSATPPGFAFSVKGPRYLTHTGMNKVSAISYHKPCGYKDCANHYDLMQ